MSTERKKFPFKLIAIACFLVLGSLFVTDESFTTAKIAGVDTKKIQHYESMLVRPDLKSIKGKEFKKEDLSKGVVILNFWASWCTPCLEEFPSLVSLRSGIENKDLKIIAINSDEGPKQDKKINEVSKKFNVNFDIVKDKNGKLTDAFMVSAIPVSIVFKDGRVMEVANGSKDFNSEEFKEKIQEWLK
ncbi:MULTISPECIES: TlpA family protein disulfide reductase [Halobacteriovorax]|uniref:TlpA family protein disulfide reductase n=1 Tax=Halobacteriovorax vibrionivorans TaxID=2152716 RepID=A0ABY0IKK8_9BACT|nr:MULTISPECIES: TlpA disulfide reductase family protein [Halobacteriovorax]AYF46004.1 redoxin [Halobacteriovorax sp. BALOs_7]RZF23030.1 TlpA family protein disulfide reductase [Halobacteriovorax vibrionivorans]TGD48798.1 TlpA family protein disulfide reductase [Halobacteriovorax sp. Y22]